MAIDFYNLGLHPITMYQKEVKEDKQKSYKGRIYLTKDNFDSSIHIYSNEAMILTNERAKNLKKKIINLGGKVFVNNSKTVYLISDIKKLNK